MAGKKIESSALRVFAQFFADQNESNILLLSLVSHRCAEATALQLELRGVELSIFSRHMHHDNATLMKAWLLSNAEDKSSEHFIGNYEHFTVIMLCIRRLFSSRPKFCFTIDISPSERRISWFSPKASEKAAKILKDFFPSAVFKLETIASMYPPVFQQTVPFIREMAPVLTNVRCGTQELPLVVKSNLNTLNIAEFWDFMCKPWYYPSLFNVKAKEIICGPAFCLDSFSQGSFPVQDKAEIFVCDINLTIQMTSGLYEDVCNEISKSLPNLKVLKCREEQFVVRGKDGYVEEQMADGMISLPYIKAIETASWHIREMANRSHLETLIDIAFELNTQEYVHACTKLFSDLLPGCSVFESTFGSEFESVENQLTYRHLHTAANIRLFRLE